MWGAYRAAGPTYRTGTTWNLKDNGAPAGTVVPADATQGVSPILIWILSRQFLGLFSAPPARGAAWQNLPSWGSLTLEWSPGKRRWYRC